MFQLLELPYLGAIRKLFFSLDIRHESQTQTRDVSRRSSYESSSSLPSDISSVSEEASQQELIKLVLVDLFDKFGYPYDTVAYDWDLHNLCYEECKRMGYPCDKSPPKGVKTVYKYLPAGVCLATTSYGHLKDRDLQKYIALFTTLLFYVDDEYVGDTTGVEMFGRCLMLGLPQQHKVLDSLADFLKGTYSHYQGPVADIIMTSALNNVASMVVENKMDGVELHPQARRFSTFLKVLSGNAEAYSMFVFPPEIPIEEYIQILPELVTFINAICDVLSFHKEELAGETINFISTQAKVRQKSKLQVLKELADDVFECHQRILRVLSEKDPRVKVWYEEFARGCFFFHTSLDMRYRLSDLFPLKPNAGLYAKEK
ncbi:isoprenoid synthase domain-containing protein [Crepidotus variabilis]|uniref:Isoprenoid synthase domain-containing protein n=1 Tax=Crepidotus variabilis TaxID=179855 RepID=A0A9P6E5F7_9AGAR|nr:isoprenoid synthase domain-containing protein [Crepidotus variabilis]